MTQGGKKTARGRKAAATKGRKTKAKKEEAVEILEDEPQAQEAPPQKPARGRKRASDALEEDGRTNVEAPEPKRRATRVKANDAVESASTAGSLPDAEMAEALSEKPAGKKARVSTAKGTRKVSQSSVRSQASTAPLRANLPDDDEIDRQLEADLARYQTDAEDPVVDSDSEKPKAPARGKGRPKKATTTRKASAQTKAQSEHYAMFDPTPVEPDEADIEAEFKALQAEMELEPPAATEVLVVPKKGRKPGTRKVSKQTKKAKEPVPPSDPIDQEMLDDAQLREPVQEPALEGVPQDELDELAVDPDVSTGTVVTKPASRPSMEKRKRGRPSKKSTASQVSVEEPEQRRPSAVQAEAEVQPRSSRVRESISTPQSTPRKLPRKPVPALSQAPDPPAAKIGPVTTTSPTKTEKALPAPPPPSADRLPHPPATPRLHPTPSASARQAAISPSQSPQSSDAENRPPSSKEASSVGSKRVALAPVAVTATPLRSSSPAKHNNNTNHYNNNMIAGLQSNTPWRPADLDLLFSPGSSDPDGDKENGVARLLRKGSELTSSERRMTVEEWIYHNAGLAEQKLKHECEAMVSAFEREGTRAIRVLEGLVVE